MPLLNLTPEWRWRVHPEVDQRKVDSFVVSDVLSDLIQGVPSAWGGVLVRGATGNNFGDWKRIGADLTITNAAYARFLPDGTVEAFPQSEQSKAFGGFYITPTLRPTSAIVSGQGTPANGAPAKGWTPYKGTWETSPALTGRGTGFLATSTGATGIASNDALKPNEGFEVFIDTVSYDQNNYGEYFLEYGPDSRLAVRHGKPPTIERRITSQNGMMQTTSWATWRRLDSEVFVPRGVRSRFAVSQVAGRKVVEWNDKTIWLLDENDEANSQNALGTRSRGKIPQWGGVPLRLEANGCRPRAEYASIDHLNEAGTAPKVATITRKLPLASAQSYAPRLIEPVASGFVPNGGDMSIAVVHDADSITYTATLKAGSNGLHSPCFSQGHFAYTPVWVSGSGEPVDFTAAVTGGRVTLAQPPAQSGSEGSVTVDLNLAAKLCPAALPLLRDFAPFDVAARWRNDATGQPLTVFRGLMQGYIFGSNGQQPGYNRQSAEYTLRDEMQRLRDEAGIIDGNFYDLFFEWQRLTKERYGIALKNLTAGVDTDTYVHPFEDNTIYVPSSVGDFYGGDAVKYIVETQLGPNVAARFNGNGNSRRFYPHGHPPLLSRRDMAGTISALALGLDQTIGIGSLGGDGKGGFFPPPYGRDCEGWGKDIGRDDLNCDFWTGHVNRDTDEWPCFLYGKYEVYLDSAMGWQLGADEAIAIAGMIEEASAETRPEKAINRVLVWSNPFGAELPYTPAFIQGEARIASGPNAPHNSWPRTLVLKEGIANWITTPAQAAAVAATVLLDINAATPFRPRFKVRGDARFLVGDVFFANNVGLNINHLYTRSASIEHQYTVDSSSGKWWTTTITAQPMTATQIGRFQRNNSLRTGYTFA